MFIGIGSICFHATLKCMLLSLTHLKLIYWFDRWNAASRWVIHDLHGLRVILCDFFIRQVQTYSESRHGLFHITGHLHFGLLPLLERSGIPPELLHHHLSHYCLQEYLHHAEITQTIQIRRKDGRWDQEDIRPNKNREAESESSQVNVAISCMRTFNRRLRIYLVDCRPDLLQHPEELASSDRSTLGLTARGSWLVVSLTVIMSFPILQYHRHVFTGMGLYYHLVFGVYLRHHLKGDQDDIELVWPSIFTSIPAIVRKDRTSSTSNGNKRD